MPLDFSEISVAEPNAETLAARYHALNTMLAGDEASVAHTLGEWDRLRRELRTWFSLVGLRFQQDTADAEAKAKREMADRLRPVSTDHETAFKRRLLSEIDGDLLDRLAGAHAVALWQNDLETFAPVIAGDLAAEAELGARYTALLASARLRIGGTDVNLAGIEAFAGDLDRETRHAAERARWEFFAANGEALDTIYDDLVKLRHGMAKKLGYDSFTPLAYRRMRRLDYGPAQVATYREQVATHVVPLVTTLMATLRDEFGHDRLRYWDETVTDPQGNPKPGGDEAFLVRGAQTMFDRMDTRLGQFYRLMVEGHLLDLDNRPSKAGGGFCTAFPTHDVPFIFANFNGTDHDIKVFTHEMGHAFQNWESRRQPGVDYLWPTMEAAEINSMGLEFLCHPHLDGLVKPGEGDRFRRMHLIDSLAFLPYGVCVDHFQHEIYAQPDATPAERHAIWQRLERHYMPWRDYGDLDYPAKGGLWQAKRHIYLSPFYYIDYTLALCCALQFWVKSLEDYDAALASYIELCGRGGSMGFDGLVRSAGLRSPFEAGALEDVVAAASRHLS